MTDWYVRSGATGTGVATSWGNAAVSASALVALATKPVAGDHVFFAHDHAANYGAATVVTWPAGPAPVECYSVDDTANYASTSHSAPDSSKLTAKPTTTTAYATEATTSFNLTFNGVFYLYGITLKPTGFLYLGDSNAAHHGRLQNCLVWINRSTAGVFNIGNGGTFGQVIELDDTDLNYTSSNATGALTVKGALKMTGGAVSGTVGTTFLSPVEIHEACLLEGVDLAAFGAGKNLVAAGYQGDVNIVGCLLGSGVTFVDTGGRPPSFNVRLVGCDVSGGSVQRHEQAMRAGDMVRDSAVYRTGSAGSQSLKVRSNATASMPAPMRVLVGRYGFDDTANKTITAFLAQKSGKTRATNKEVWLEALPSVAASPRHALITSAATSPLHAAADLTTDAASSWVGLTTPVLSTITLSIDAASYQAGAVDIYLCAGKDFSATDDEIYVDVAVV